MERRRVSPRRHTAVRTSAAAASPRPANWSGRSVLLVDGQGQQDGADRVQRGERRDHTEQTLARRRTETERSPQCRRLRPRSTQPCSRRGRRSDWRRPSHERKPERDRRLLVRHKRPHAGVVCGLARAGRRRRRTARRTREPSPRPTRETARRPAGRAPMLHQARSRPPRSPAPASGQSRRAPARATSPTAIGTIAPVTAVIGATTAIAPLERLR